MMRNVRSLLLLSFFVLLLAIVAVAQTPNPTSVTIAGSLQSELGCPGDWQPECAATHLGYDASDDVWQGTFMVPAGNWEYKAPLNDSWTENYGLNATRDGANIPLNLGAARAVKFYYDHKSHWITSNVNSVIAVAPGSFQSELDCPGDWAPDCLRSWLQDTDGDGTYTATFTLPGGSYEAKVAINESWDENYGQGGVPNGPNIPFNVPQPSGQVIFSYNATSHVLTIVGPEPSADNNVEWDGLRHDSRDSLYRTPGGAAPANKSVRLRFRTFHDDVTGVTLRLFDVDAGAQQLLPMTRAAEDVSCYQEDLSGKTCDYWELTLNPNAPKNYWYRFIVTDGSDTDYYADNTRALDGGQGATSEDAIDDSYSLMFYNPAFTAPAWAQNAIIYQIFPDRFRNGRRNNDARTGDVRYDDPVLALSWNTLPEGYCRNYADADTNCPWRFDSTPPPFSLTKEAPRGRDYFGGDLRGVDQKLEYLQALGVNTIYFNPIFDAGSNHSYDTQDYYNLDPYFGDYKDWLNLVKHADRRGIRIILDNVFNHLSSDSFFFDRYRHYALKGACESRSSLFRNWFNFRAPAGSEPAPCVPSTPGGADTYYDGWFGFDSIPVIKKTNPLVQQFFVTSPLSVTRHWLRLGASGWRLDVMGDPSFPAGYWESFRQVVKQTKSNALIIGELWQKDSTLLRNLRGDRADTTMNYRLRDAVIAFLAPQNFDSKGFADSGRQITPSEFTSRLQSIGEDYPQSVYHSLMNLLDSHDTERVLWTLTPGAETRFDKEVQLENVTEGKRRLRLASLLQFFVPGAPTVYYGDEVGITGDDDPDDRRTYPWADLGGSPDQVLFQHYQSLATIRKGTPALTGGDFRALLADNQAETVALGRKTNSQAAIAAVNRSDQPRIVSIPVGGYLPDGIELTAVYGVENTAGDTTILTSGTLQLSLAPRSGLLLTTGEVDLEPPNAPDNLRVTGEVNGQVSLAWNSASDASSYNVYRSVLSGGGYVKANSAPVSGTTFTDTGLSNAKTYFYVVTALDAIGNESAYSNEVSAVPHLQIGWANLQWPPSMTHTISTVDRTDDAFGQVWIDGVTNQPGQTPGLRAQLGFGPDGSNPAGNSAWSWTEATFNVDAGNNDEFKATLLPMTTGTFDYAYRYSTTNGRDWVYADLDGIGNGYDPSQAGDLVVNSSGDTTAPAVPTNLRVASSSLSSISLQWDVVSDSSLHGYEVLRGTTSGGPYQQVGSSSTAEFTDSSVVSGTIYFYVVRAVDTSFNRSGNSNQVSATAEPRTVTLSFTVTVPASTDATGRSVYIAGTLNRLNGGLPEWNPGGVVLTRVDATHWTISLSGDEGTQIEYKYTLGDWEHVEKGGTCEELSNRMLTLNYGATGTQSVSDGVLNWRNVAPCGN